MRKNARRKVLALLLAVMTVGHSLSLTSFADSSTPQTDSSISAVGTQSNETSQSFVIDQTNRDAVSYPDKGVSKTVNSDGKNDNAPKLSAGYDIDSPTFDLRTDVLKQLTNGQDPLDSKLAFDNFPIKGYTQSLGTKTVLELSGNGSLYYGTKDHSSTTIRFVTHTGEEKLPTLTQSDVKWGLMPCYEQYDEVYADGEQVSGDPTRYIITARNATGKRTRAYFTIKGIGTCLTKIYTDKMAFINVDFPFNGIEDIKVFSYTGEEIRPCVGVSSLTSVEPLIEGKDYEFIYTNNIKCGLAMVEATPKGDRVYEGSGARSAFVIIPQKPVIKSVKADGSRLIAELEDQSKTNPSGYRIQYRAKGETEWQESFSKGASPFVCAYDVEPEKEYEVQVSGYTEVIEGNSHWWYGDRITMVKKAR